MLKDYFNRKIDYLRLSVTDKCNLRCVYCMPKGYSIKKFSNPLTDEEIVNAINIFTETGIKKVRLTGGEPMQRPGIKDLISEISRNKNVKDLSLTTNGVNLKKHAKDLKASGLKRINISIDTINQEKFKQITGFDKLEDVLSGIYAAIDSGLSPVKINVVLFKGINDDEVENFIALTKKLPIHIRFIEAMPIGNTNYFTRDKWLPFTNIEKTYPLISLNKKDYPVGCGPARYFKLENAVGTVGFISALSNNFCSSCNRVRLSSKGVLYPCLSSDDGINVRELFKNPKLHDAGSKIIRDAITLKPEKHNMRNTGKVKNNAKQYMCQIGG